MALTSKLTNIADAIREKTGGTDTLTLDGMVEAIAGISTGGDTSAEDSIIMKTIAGGYSNSRVTSIGSHIFNNSNLTSVNFLNVTSISGNAFNSCSQLTSVDFPKAANIEAYAFGGCNKLTSVNFPQLTSISGNVFNGCSQLTSVDFPMLSYIGSSAFGTCSKLTSLVLRCETVCTLSSTNAFSATPISSGTGYVYVPDALVEDYKAAANWSTYASQIKPLSEYVEVSA